MHEGLTAVLEKITRPNAKPVSVEADAEHLLRVLGRIDTVRNTADDLLAEADAVREAAHEYAAELERIAEAKRVEARYGYAE